MWLMLIVHHRKHDGQKPYFVYRAQNPNCMEKTAQLRISYHILYLCLKWLIVNLWSFIKVITCISQSHTYQSIVQQNRSKPCIATRSKRNDQLTGSFVCLRNSICKILWFEVSAYWMPMLKFKIYVVVSISTIICV